MLLSSFFYAHALKSAGQKGGRGLGEGLRVAADQAGEAPAGCAPGEQLVLGEHMHALPSSGIAGVHQPHSRSDGAGYGSGEQREVGAAEHQRVYPRPGEGGERGVDRGANLRICVVRPPSLGQRDKSPRAVGKDLYLRAVGESPATADAAGINVTRNKYLATVIGGGISAIGGMVYITTIAGCVWNHEGLAGEGWLAVALVIFCLWRPVNAIWGSVLFGALMILYLRLQLPFIPDQLYKILPYVVTVIVLIFTSMRNSKDKQPPASLGLPFFREER